jgi:hypothetical protein
MALDNVYQLTLKQLWGTGGEPMLNHFFYYSEDATAAALPLIEAFRAAGGVLDLINDIQGTWVKNDLLRAINLGSFTDFAEDVIAGTGAAEAEQILPPHSAINYTLKLDTREVRNGSKRFSGIGEVFQEHGIVTSAPYIAALNALKVALGVPIVWEDATFDPIVVKRVGLPTPGSPPYTSYRLPVDDTELVYGNVSAVLVNMRVSHQVSRGNGR